MKELINKIYNRLSKGSSVKEKYPEVVQGDGKIHVLYLHCLINSKGLYRMILPYIQLNKTSTHAAVIGTMHKWDFTKSFLDYDNVIEAELIDWADYIVFPDFNGDLGEVARAFKEINPSVKISIDVTEFALQKTNGDFIEPSPQMLAKLKNFRSANLVSFHKGAIADIVEPLMNINEPKHGTSFAVIPDLISAETFLTLESNQLDNENKIRIGFIGQPKIAEKIKEIVPFLLPILSKHKDKIQLVSLGWKGKLDNKPLFDGFEIEYHKPVNISNYYTKVHSLNLDLVILTELSNDQDELTRSAIKYIELAALAVPVAVKQETKLSSLIVNNETGVVIQEPREWGETIKKLVHDLASFKQMGQFAQKVAWKQLSWNRFKTKLLANTYM